jgi:hypothetical protein
MPYRFVSPNEWRPPLVDAEKGILVWKRFVFTLAVIATFAVAFAASSSASGSQEVTIQTSKAPGPVSGTFSATGAFVDSGAINNLDIGFVALGAPDFGITHLTILFTGDDGTFTLKAHIKETLTSDPNVLTDNGTWTIIAGTGAYADLHGHGTVVGTVDDNVNLITRTYEGDVHFD